MLDVMQARHDPCCISHPYEARFSKRINRCFSGMALSNESQLVVQADGAAVIRWPQGETPIHERGESTMISCC